MPDYTVELISQEISPDGACHTEKAVFAVSAATVCFRSVEITLTPTGDKTQLVVSTADGKARTFTVESGSVLRVPYPLPAGRGIMEIHLV